MCFDNKYKYRTLHGRCYYIIKQKAKNKHYLKDCIE